MAQSGYGRCVLSHLHVSLFICKSAKQIVKSEPAGKWARQNGRARGKSTIFKACQKLSQGSPEGFLVFHILHGHSKGNGNV